ncbi:hypothetical protein ACFY3J_13715 [Streptomyces sp. NPDC001231]|uniref:hypothetical protein n=1 Tax=unclassified Streptomyces TaxID=2593676 RepID=UPI00369941BC
MPSETTYANASLSISTTKRRCWSSTTIYDDIRHGRLPIHAHADDSHTTVAVGAYLDSGTSVYLHGEDMPVWPRGRGMPRGHTGTVARHKPEVPRAAPVAS